MKKAERLGKLHSKLWRFHDETKWNSLKNTAYNFLRELGYSEKLSKYVAPHIVRTFKEADLAYEAQMKGETDREDKHYKNMLLEFEKGHKILKCETKSLKYKINWIKASRHHNVPSIFVNLFLEHYEKFERKKILLALRETWISGTSVYQAHKIHNWAALDRALSTYWLVLEQNYKENKKLPPQF